MEIKTGRSIKEEDVKEFVDIMQKTLAEFIESRNLGVTHAVVILSHAAPPPEGAPEGMVSVQGGAIDIYSHSEYTGTPSGDSLGNHTVKLALEWAGSFLNDED